MPAHRFDPAPPGAACHDRAFERYCRGGAPDDLAEVYDATADRLLRNALHLTSTMCAAEDLVQATFLAAIEKAPTFQLGRPVLPWLMGILSNQARLARWRDGRSPQPDRLVAKSPPAPFESVENEEFQRALDSAIEELPDSYRSVLFLHLRNQLPAAEIALALGRPPGTVRSQLSRGMELIRQALPASLAGLLAVEVFAARGLAGIRTAVLAQLPVTASTTACAGGAGGGVLLAGGIVMKQVLLAVAVVVAVGFAWNMWPVPESVQPDALVPDDEWSAAVPADSQGPSGAARAGRKLVEPTAVDPTAEASAAASADHSIELPGPGMGALEVHALWAGSTQSAAGVTVVVVGRVSAWDEWLTARTNEKGVALFERLPVGSQFLRGLCGGEASAEIIEGQTTEIRLLVPAGVAVDVLVVDGTGTAIPNATVWLSERWRTNRGLSVGETDARGRMALANVSPDCYVAVRCRGYKPSPANPVKGAVGGTVRFRITLERGGGTVEGLVLDPLGQPVADARVLIGTETPAHSHRSTSGSWIPGAPPIYRRTDHAGRFRADGVNPGKVPVQVRHDDYAPKTCQIELLADRSARQTIILEPAATLAGLVTDADGATVAFAAVRVGQRRSFAERAVFADRDGRFLMRGLPAGETKVTASRHKQSVTAELRLQAGQEFEWTAILRATTAGENLRIHGRVVDHTGKPLRRWRVAAQPMNQPRTTRSASTDRAGRFEIDVKWDLVRVWVHPPRAWDQFPPWIRNDVRPADGEILIRVEPAHVRAGTVRATIVDPSGKPVQAQVEVWQQEFGLWRQYATDAKTGQLRVENVPPGELHVKICPREHPWMKLKPHMVEAGIDLDLGRIVVKPASRIEGHARYVDGEAPSKLTIQVLDQNNSEATVVRYANGGFRSGPLAAGVYTLNVSGPRVAGTSAKVRVREGETATAEFKLQRAALRVLRLQFSPGVQPPRYLSVVIRSLDGKTAWFGGFSGTGPAEVTASAAIGSYRINVWGPKKTLYLDSAFEITTLEDATPLVLTLHAPVKR